MGMKTSGEAALNDEELVYALRNNVGVSDYSRKAAALAAERIEQLVKERDDAEWVEVLRRTYQRAKEAEARIEQLVKEVDRRIEPEQVEKLIMLADPIMSELYAVECSYRQEAEAKLPEAGIVALKTILDERGPVFDAMVNAAEDADLKHVSFNVVVSRALRAAITELEKDT